MFAYQTEVFSYINNIGCSRCLENYLAEHTVLPSACESFNFGGLLKSLIKTMILLIIQMFISILNSSVGCLTRHLKLN
jgi:hypothetical protein